MVINNKIISIIQEEVKKMNNIFSAEHVAQHIFSLLEPEQEENDVAIEDYLKMIKDISDEYELIEVDPNNLKNYRKDWDSNSVETYEYLFRNNRDVPEIIIDTKYRIIDGNNRATAAMLQKRKIMAFKAMEK